MAFNINNFIEQTKDGFAREAHFELIILLPSIVSGDSRKLSFLCNSASLPDRRLETAKIRRTGQGFITSFVTGSEYGHLDVTFLCDSRADNLKLLHKWMDSIFNVQGPTGLHTVAYKDDYATKITLIQYNSEGKAIAEWDFLDAFPEFLSKVNFSWASKDNIISVPASFVYSYYIEKAQTPTIEQQKQTNLQEAQNNRLAARAAQNINNEQIFSLIKR